MNYKKVFKTPFFEIEESTEKFDNNSPHYRINSSDSVICCLINDEDKIVLVSQLRPNLGYETLEFPAGGIDRNESPIQAVSREVREETGMTCDFKALGSYRLLMNRTVNKEHLFVGLVKEKGKGNLEDLINVKEIDRKKFLSLVNDNKFEQLAALGIIQLINLRFNINFLNDKSIINKIWEDYER
jgi:8-oxo-dGTP pyrophosphatase MutT (NUDIX family)